MTGPGLVSGAGVLGVELAPTRVRSVAQSITVAGGRIGAAISGFAFPLLFGTARAASATPRLLGGGGPRRSGRGGHLAAVPETGRISLEAITDEVVLPQAMVAQKPA